jgi:hypothetical protein
VRGRLLAVIASITLLATGCSGGAATSSTPTTRAPLPAGVLPSPIAKQVCQREAQKDIASALGENAVVSTPTWVDHLYSCDYTYPTGSMALSVKELSSWGETDAYFGTLAGSMGKTRDLEALGQRAFQTTNGSVVVRKDWKVLVVDVAGLPQQFGVPPTSSGDVAVTVADVILGCWAGD